MFRRAYAAECEYQWLYSSYNGYSPCTDEAQTDREPTIVMTSGFAGGLIVTPSKEATHQEPPRAVGYTGWGNEYSPSL